MVYGIREQFWKLENQSLDVGQDLKDVKHHIWLLTRSYLLEEDFSWFLPLIRLIVIYQEQRRAALRIELTKQLVQFREIR